MAGFAYYIIIFQRNDTMYDNIFHMPDGMQGVNARCYSFLYYNQIYLNLKIKPFLCFCRVEGKILNVAILGVPNSGKSTLINQLVGRQVL